MGCWSNAWGWNGSSGHPIMLGGYAAVVVFGSSGLDRRTADALGRRRPTEPACCSWLARRWNWPRWPPSCLLRSVCVPDVSRRRRHRCRLRPWTSGIPIFRPFAPDGGLLGSVRFRRVLRVTPGTTRRCSRVSATGLPRSWSSGAAGAACCCSRPTWPARGTTSHDIPRSCRSSTSWSATSSPAGPPSETCAWVSCRAWTARRPRHRGAAGGRSPAKDGAQVRRVAVNTEPRESQDTRMTPDAFVAAVPRTGAAHPRHAWPSRVRASRSSRGGATGLPDAARAGRESLVGRRT
jgi:hypothetical protein